MPGTYYQNTGQLYPQSNPGLPAPGAFDEYNYRSSVGAYLDSLQANLNAAGNGLGNLFAPIQMDYLNSFTQRDQFQPQPPQSAPPTYYQPPQYQPPSASYQPTQQPYSQPYSQPPPQRYSPPVQSQPLQFPTNVLSYGAQTPVSQPGLLVGGQPNPAASVTDFTLGSPTGSTAPNTTAGGLPALNTSGVNPYLTDPLMSLYYGMQNPSYQQGQNFYGDSELFRAPTVAGAI